MNKQNLTIGLQILTIFALILMHFSGSIQGLNSQAGYTGNVNLGGLAIDENNPKEVALKAKIQNFDFDNATDAQFVELCDEVYYSDSDHTPANTKQYQQLTNAFLTESVIEDSDRPVSTRCADRVRRLYLAYLVWVANPFNPLFYIIYQSELEACQRNCPGQCPASG